MTWRTTMFWLGVASMFTSISVSALAQDDPVECDAPLLQRDEIKEDANSDSFVSLLYLVNEKNFEEAKGKASAAVKSWFDGSYENFDQKRTEYLSKQSRIKSVKEARSISKSLVPIDAVKEWSSCVQTKLRQESQAGLIVYPTDVACKTAVLTVWWNPLPTMDRTIRVQGVDLVGHSGDEDLSNLKELADGKQLFLLRFNSESMPISGVIRVATQTGVFSDSFTILPNCRSQFPEPVSYQGNCVTEDGKFGKLALKAWCANLNGSPHGCRFADAHAEPDTSYISETGTAGASKRIAARWSCEPVERTVASPSCPPNSCVAAGGNCGKVKIKLWCTNPDGSSHGCREWKERPAPGTTVMTTRATSAGSARGKRAAVLWKCNVR